MAMLVYSSKPSFLSLFLLACDHGVNLELVSLDLFHVLPINSPYVLVSKA